MLNKNYRIGSKWKLFLMLPLVTIAFYLVSCTEKGETLITDDPIREIAEEVDMNEEIPAIQNQSSLEDEEVFYIIDNMPTFQGGDPGIEFRKYIAKNIRYPREAAENGATGKIFISFTVTRTGKVVIDPSVSGITDRKNQDEVVVTAYRTLAEDQEKPEQKYIDLLKEEVIRLVSESPDWEPGSHMGKAVNVLFTFPVTFALQ